MEFSDQDDFSLLGGPHEIKVKPPPGFKEDLGLLGNKFSLNNNNAEQDRSPNIQSSLGNQFNAQNNNPFANLLQNNNQASSTATPNLPSFNPLAGLTQEQIQQLALLQFLQNNPALGFGFGLGQPQQQVIYLLKKLKSRVNPPNLYKTKLNYFFYISTRLSHQVNQFIKPRPCMLQALFPCFWEPKNSLPHSHKPLV